MNSPVEIRAALDRARARGVDPATIARYEKEYGISDIPEVPKNMGGGESAEEIIEALKRAEERGVDPEKLKAYEEQYLGPAKAQAAQEHQQALAEQTTAARRLEGADDTVLENAVQGVQQAAAGIIGNVVEPVGDIVGSPAFLAYNLITGKHSDTASLLRNIGVDSSVQPVQENEVAKAINTVGAIAGTIPAFVSVARDPGKVSSVFFDLVGLGSSEAPLATGASSVAQRLGKAPGPDITTDAGVLEEANTIARRIEVDNNKENFTAFEEAMAARPAWEKQTQKLQDKWTKLTNKVNELTEAGQTGKVLDNVEDKLKSLIDEMAQHKLNDPTLVKPGGVPALNNGGRNAYNIKRSAVLDGLERLGVGRAYADELLRGQEGFYKTKGFQELIEFESTDMKKFYKGDGTSIGVYDRVLRPAAAVFRSKVGTVPSYMFERAFERTARSQELLTIKYNRDTDALKELADWAEVGTNKAKFLDLHKDPELLSDLVNDAKTKLKPAAYELFQELVKDSRLHQSRMSKVFKKEIRLDEHFWASQKKAKVVEKADGPYTPGDAQKRSTVESTVTRETIKGAQKRSRAVAAEMEEDQLAEYGNPVLEQIKRINQEQALYHLTDSFGMRPSMGLNANTEDFFTALEDTIGRQSGSKAKARVGREIVENTYIGSTKRPPKAVEIFMKQAYAGTLGQVDSALLNMHDAFISMQRNGVRPTLKAILDKEGMDITDLGIGGDVKSLGEFQQAFEDQLGTGKLDWWAKKAEGYQRFAFAFSGFRMMDRAGKGIVMRAALNKARAAAKGGRLAEEFGYMMKPEELAKINKALKEGISIEDMGGETRKLVEDLMFARLGEQQLISAAGRPLAYLKNPNMRWLYALSGFAIKQMEMLKVGTYDAIRAGKYAEAGKFLASYLMFASGGFAIMDTAREFPQAMLGNESKEPSVGKFAREMFVEQPLSVVSFNRLGSQYQNAKFQEDPLGAAGESLLPPMGLVGNMLKDISRAARGKEAKFYTLNSIPYGDEIRAMIDN